MMDRRGIEKNERRMSKEDPILGLKLKVYLVKLVDGGLFELIGNI